MANEDNEKDPQEPPLKQSLSHQPTPEEVKITEHDAAEFYAELYGVCRHS